MNLPSCINQNWLANAPKAYTNCPPVTIEEKIIVPHLMPKTLQESGGLILQYFMGEGLNDEDDNDYD